MPKISIQHPDLGPEKTYLSTDVSASDTLSLVENNNGFATNDIILFGELGEEKSELVTVTGVTGNSQIDHSTGPVFAHSARTPIYEIDYNQAEVYSASSEGGSYSLVATVSLDVDEPYTVYNDTAGDQNTWYKVRYKNSVTTTYSDYTDEVQGSGYTDTSLNTLINATLEDYGDEFSDELSRSQVRNYLNAAVKHVVRKLIKTYPDYRTNYTTQTLTSGTATYNLPTRFLAFKRVDVNYTGSAATGAHKAKFESELEGQPNTVYQTVDPRVFIRGTQFGLRPTPTSSSGTAFIWYWDYPAAMTNEADEHGLPYGVEECLVFYALYRAWLTKNQDRADRYKGIFDDYVEEYIEFVGQQRQMFWKPKIDLMFGTDLYEGY